MMGQEKGTRNNTKQRDQRDQQPSSNFISLLPCHFVVCALAASLPLSTRLLPDSSIVLQHIVVSSVYLDTSTVP